MFMLVAPSSEHTTQHKKKLVEVVLLTVNVQKPVLMQKGDDDIY